MYKIYTFIWFVFNLYLYFATVEEMYINNLLNVELMYKYNECLNFIL